MRITSLAVLTALSLAPPAALAQGMEMEDLASLLLASVVVEIVEERFISVTVDDVPPTSPGAGLINERPRMFEYLVQFQMPARQAFLDVITSSDPRGTFVRNVVADSAAARNLLAYLMRYNTSSAEAALPIPAHRVAESDVMRIAGRFFHPVRSGERSVRIYRCAGINGIADLGAARDPFVEAFVFSALAPHIFDADSAAAPARSLNVDFLAARTSFLDTVEDADWSQEAFGAATTSLYESMSVSDALRGILRRAYVADGRLPFRVREWDVP
jgi:hypothetical protein